jgi:hypothetical protein
LENNIFFNFFYLIIRADKSGGKKRKNKEGDDDDEEKFYIVEKILGKKIVANKVYYLIKWLHYDKEEDMTWEPRKNLENV